MRSSQNELISLNIYLQTPSLEFCGLSYEYPLGPSQNNMPKIRVLEKQGQSELVVIKSAVPVLYDIKKSFHRKELLWLSITLLNAKHL